MTQIKLKWFDIDGRTPLRAAEGRVTIQPYSRTIVDDAIVTDTPFTWIFEGETIVNLPPSPAGTAYKVTWNSFLDEPWDEFIVVPNVDGVIDYVDLQQVSPESLDPIVKPEPEWWARVNDAVTGVSVRDGHIYVQTGDGQEKYVGDLATGPVGPQGPKGDKGDKGDQGIQGMTGPVGPKGEQGVAGKDGVAGPVGPKGDQGPKGETGDRGPQGIQGVAGKDGIQGPKGDQGDQGLTGATGPKGDKGEQGIQGIAGKDGESAYQIAVRNGYSGTEKEWIDSLKAVAGEGISGESAYQIAVRYGYVGSETEWLASLVGRRGETGPQGPQGDRGLTGPIGPKGDKGNTGDTGPAGPTGPNGDSAYEVAVKNGYIGTESEWLATLKAEGGGSGTVNPENVLTLKYELVGLNKFSFETTAKPNMRIGEYNRDRYIPQGKMTDSSGATYTVYASKGYLVNPGETIYADSVRSIRVERTANYITRNTYQGDSSKIVNTNSYSYKNDTGAEIHYVYFDIVVKDGAEPPKTMVQYNLVRRPYEEPVYSNKPLLVDFTGLSVDKGFIVDDLNDLKTAAYGMDPSSNLSNFNLSYNMAVRDQYNPGLLDANSPSLYPGRSQFVVFNNGFDTTRISSSIKQIGYPIPGNTRNVALILHYTYGRYGFALVWLTTPSVQSGTGRPDVPATTNKMITGSEPIGHKYYSTDGGGVGAVEWMKMDASRWKVTTGDSGWISLSAQPFLSTLFPGWDATMDVFAYRIIDGVIYWNVKVKSSRPVAEDSLKSASIATVSGLPALVKSGIAKLEIPVYGPAGSFARIYASDSGDSLLVYTPGALIGSDTTSGTCSYPIDTYPTSLPGTKI